MNYSAEQNRIDRKNEYEQLFGADYDGFQNNNVEEKATVINNQINFEEWVHSHANQEIKLSIYSLYTKKFRDIKIHTNLY